VSSSPAVFFDRDGVLNQAIVRRGTPHPPAHASELKVEDGVAQALQRLSGHIPLIFVVTNQPDVTRGTQTRAEVERMNAALERRMPIVATYVCYHDDADACTCRKPLPGLLLKAAAEHGIDLQRSYMVGDRWRDVEAGTAAGCTTILVQHGYDERAPQTPPTVSVKTVAEAVEAIIAFERDRCDSDKGATV
jgi:D-glycero-D-manno-heptose 1,7-bisphosphate phosphatase